MSEPFRAGFTECFVPARTAHHAAPFGTVAQALRTMLTRRDLAELEPRLLEDIGVNRGEAIAEAARAPWDLAPPPRRPERHGMWHAVTAAIRRRRERVLLSRLDARTLRDLGYSYGEIDTEANKPFWRR
jgi:uncharacterized protein YjiS (DUF1127 family)